MRAVTAARVVAFSDLGPPSIPTRSGPRTSRRRPRPVRLPLQVRSGRRRSAAVAVPLRLSGRHQVANAAAAAAAALAVGVDLERLRRRLVAGPAAVPLADGAARAGRRRWSWSTTPTTPTRTRCAAALDTLAAIGGRVRGRASWAVLGDMLELGDDGRGRARRARVGASPSPASTGWSRSARTPRRSSRRARRAGLAGGRGDRGRDQGRDDRRWCAGRSARATWCWSRPPVA